MFSDTTIARLRWHAGYDGNRPQPEGSAIKDCRAGTPNVERQLAAAFKDVIDVLVEVNIQANGEVPSETYPGSEPASSFPRLLIAAVAEILRLLKELDAAGVPSAARAARMVNSAWDAVIDGDIDDIWRHVESTEQILNG